ncbi:superoxide dismutase family protein [Nonomuraea pusilla]|uniref:Superoxide dismutase, Cu-Zn family n=1 Tax=Nonomuraea pusilla TaxID=46177 RepID=A0A1H8A8T3_9ACTN|nr:superoxide dismutase family protein [Nonomuraea pusilla]SEM66886.1 superoxide dismutase, Cu-Zn family [Nonomuraea pusilla]
MRLPALLLVLLAAGCSGSPDVVQHVPAAAGGPDGPAGAVTLSGSGEFAAGNTAAIAYDRRLAPSGAQASLKAESTGGTTRTSLVVEGFVPNRRYGAHLHTGACATDPEASGPHYQHHPGQVTPSSEVWLDFKTDASGAGRATARHEWALDPAALPKSLVIHAQPTKKKGEQAGTAGPRIACLTLS